VLLLLLLPSGSNPETGKKQKSLETVKNGARDLLVVERGVDPRTPRFSGVCSAD
jgi:hypothetical protein